MRRLFTSRAGIGETEALEGREGLPLEGDLLHASADEGPALRPYAATLAVPEPEAATPAGAEAEIALQRAGELSRLGRRSDAVHVLRSLLAERPGEERASRDLARHLESAGEPDTALEVLTTALGLQGDHVGLRSDRGALAARLGMHAEAERDLRHALGVAPNDPGAHLQLGLVLFRLSRLTDALDHLQRAAMLAPDDADAAFHLGEAWYQKGALDRALAALERAATLRPEARAYSLLGRLLDRLGRTEEAMIMHRRARDAAAR